MRRILFQLRGITVWSHPAMLYLGLVAGIILGNAVANAERLDTFAVFIATCVLIVPSLAGARLFYVATHLSAFRNDKSRIWDTNVGGQATYGGMLLAVPLSIPLLKVLGVPFGHYWDVASFTVLTGMVFTRVGCLLNGCCAGRPSNAWGCLRLPNHLGVWEKRIPNQLLEAGWAALILISITALRGRLPFPGALFVFTAGSYALGRLALEFAREQNTARHGFTIHHAISLFVIVLSAAALTLRGQL